MTRVRDVHSLATNPFARYVAISALALVVDASVLALLVRGGVPTGLAAAAGYSLGIVVNWLLSSRLVFGAEASLRPGRRNLQKALFLLSALAGLAVTSLTVSGGVALGLPLAAAKLVATGLSFFACWLVRRHIVFAKAVAAT